MACDVRRITMEEFEHAPGVGALMAEYAAEAAIHEIGPPNPQFATYRAMEASGMFHTFGAFADGQLVGFLFLITPTLPHFGQLVGVTESFFVGAAHRKSGAGTQLRLVAEETAGAAGAAGILMSVPFGGKLGKVLPRAGYRETNTTFYKKLK